MRFACRMLSQFSHDFSCSQAPVACLEHPWHPGAVEFGSGGFHHAIGETLGRKPWTLVMVMVAQCLPNELVRHWDEISLLIIFDGDADVSIIKICVNQPWKSMEISALNSPHIWRIMLIYDFLGFMLQVMGIWRFPKNRATWLPPVIIHLRDGFSTGHRGGSQFLCSLGGWTLGGSGSCWISGPDSFGGFNQRG